MAKIKRQTGNNMFTQAIENTVKPHFETDNKKESSIDTQVKVEESSINEKPAAVTKEDPKDAELVIEAVEEKNEKPLSVSNTEEEKPKSSKVRKTATPNVFSDVKKKASRGKSQTTYYPSEVYDKIIEYTEKYGISFSVVVSKILEDYFDKN